MDLLDSIIWIYETTYMAINVLLDCNHIYIL